MDTIIEQYLKGHFSLEKQKEILHYIQVNKELKTVDIKGKAYVEVNERVKAFR